VLLRDGRPAIVGGSPSVSLVACVLQNIVNLVDFAMPIAESVAAPRFGARPHDPAFGWRPGVMLENGFPPEMAGAFRDWTARERLWSRVVGPWYTLMGNYEGIVVDAGGTATASADPRRVGSAEAVR
jgi:gamma-glutamyltranspeptidase/glutathione hydrolase